MLLLVCSGCATTLNVYRGRNPDLYTVAINSLLGIRGYYQQEQRFDPFIEVIEEDDYGRKLFSYWEGESIRSVVICQKSDKKYAYFYPDYNFLSAQVEGQYRNTGFLISDHFIDNKIDELKKLNDWNIEIDQSKCVKVKIVRGKPVWPTDEEKVMEVYNSVLGDDSMNSKTYVRQFITDDYGRAIYLGYGTSSSDRVAIMLINQDGTYNDETGVMEMTRDDLSDYQSKLKDFKEQSDWNKP